MKVNEIFLSIQGEGIYTGFPTIFIRFSGCNLRCSYCDTVYAYDEGTEMEPFQVYDEIKKYCYKRVCLTGGEPLLQTELKRLLDILHGYMITIETNGSIPVNSIERAYNQYFVLDMKCPSSGFSDKMFFDNFDFLGEKDEVKFVIASGEDYEWAKDIIDKYYKAGIITFSPVFGKIQYSDIVEWILKDRLNVRFQLQLHKLIWDPGKRGV